MESWPNNTEWSKHFVVFFALSVSNMCLPSLRVLPSYLYSLATAFVVIPYCILYNYLHSLFQPHLAIPDKILVLCSLHLHLFEAISFVISCSQCFYSSSPYLCGGRLVHQSYSIRLWPLQPLNGYLDWSWSCSSFGQVPSFSFLTVRLQETQDTLMLGMFFQYF